MHNDPEMAAVAARFRRAYAAHRAREGRSSDPAQLLALPYVKSGALAAQWRVRSRTYRRFMHEVIGPLERTASGRPLRALDLGSGNGWLSYRLRVRGHAPVALDWRWDDVDGLGAARGYRGHIDLFDRVAASFQDLPFRGAIFDLAVFNASIHYATDLVATLTEAVRVLVPSGRIVVLDSPFYRNASDGEAMVAEKKSGRSLDLGQARKDLLALPTIEYLTRQRLEQASSGLGISWQRHRVLYPLSYELRTIWAVVRGRRRPSRFDVWEGRRLPADPA